MLLGQLALHSGTSWALVHVATNFKVPIYGHNRTNISKCVTIFNKLILMAVVPSTLVTCDLIEICISITILVSLYESGGLCRDHFLCVGDFV